MIANGTTIGPLVTTYKSSGTGPGRLNPAGAAGTPESYVDASFFPGGTLPAGVTITEAQGLNALARIEANLASAAAARRVNAAAEELHATDYLMYAYLQTAQDATAKRVVATLPEILGRFNAGGTVGAAPPSAAAFAYAAVPARWTLERGAWAEAAALEPRPSALPYADALTHLARAIGAARSGNVGP